MSSDKKNVPGRLDEFRPISLVTSLYKIIAKVLSLRRDLLRETVSAAQGAFVRETDSGCYLVYTQLHTHSTLCLEQETRCD